MSQIAGLSKSAAIMLLRFIELGGSAAEAKEDTMELMGLADDSQYYRARKELQRAGLLDQRSRVTFGSVAQVVAPPALIVAPEPEPVVDSRSWREQAMDADLMPCEPDEESRRRPNSQFQVRRRQQVVVLQAAFKELFGQELMAPNAKSFLVMTGDYAEDVIDAFEKTAGAPKKIEFPMSYIKSVLASARPKATAQVRQTGIDEADPVMMSDYTPATKRKAKKIEAYLASKGNDGWEE